MKKRLSLQSGKRSDKITKEVGNIHQRNTACARPRSGTSPNSNKKRTQKLRYLAAILFKNTVLKFGHELSTSSPNVSMQPVKF
jgi:hypothetical protein